jgi:hypothetical protein
VKAAKQCAPPSWAPSYAKIGLRSGSGRGAEFSTTPAEVDLASERTLPAAPRPGQWKVATFIRTTMER